MIEGISLLWLWAILVSAIIAIFRIMEDTTTPDAKRKVADWIKSIATKSVSQTVVESPRWFVEAFDRIFGDRHLTLRCFSRSCVASILAVSVMAIVSVVLNPSSWHLYFSLKGIRGIFIILLCASILNLVLDYISLLETRLILRRVAHAGTKKLIVFLVLDVIITGGIFFYGVGWILSMLWRVTGDPESNFFGFLLVFVTGWIFDDPLYIGSIFFYSTYFTSVWFYLFVASSIATKFLYSLGRVGNWVMVWLDVEEKPFQSMGIIVVGLLTLAFAIYAIMGAVG